MPRGIVRAMRRPTPSFALAAALLWLPRLATGYEIAAPTVQAAEVAAEMLERGGSAADAIVAASFALEVTQPYSMGMGGGGFLIAARQGRATFLNSRESAPASASAGMFLRPDGAQIPRYPDRETGPNPVGVPGTVRGLGALHRQFGRLAWSELLKPAIKFAQDGFPLTEKFEECLAEEWPRIQIFPVTRRAFSDEDGEPLKAGQLLKQPELARTLATLAEGGPDAFYIGPLAKSWLEHARQLGVRITTRDLASYAARVETPVRFSLFGFDGLTAPPSSAAGLMVAGTLRYLAQRPRRHRGPLDLERVVATTEALAYHQEVSDRLIADPPYGRLDPRTYLGSDQERMAWRELDRRIAVRLARAQASQQSSEPPSQPRSAPTRDPRPARESELPKGQGHTAHLSILDDDGLAVSYTTSIEEWFGSGLLIPGYGFLLNNELSDFSSEPGNPNAPAPSKRPRSNMSPTILLARDKPVAVVGCAGGALIPTVVVEMIENYYLEGLTARAALALPRFHPDGAALLVDAGLPKRTLAGLKAAGYTVAVKRVGGVAQALLRRRASDPFEAVSEPRSDGLAIHRPGR